MPRFARVEPGDDKTPDESTILRFRHPLERKGLTEGIFEVVKDLLTERRRMLRVGADKRFKLRFRQRRDRLF